MKKKKYSKRSGRKVWLSLLVSLLFAIGLLLPGDPVGADDPIPTPAPEGSTEWSAVTVTPAEVAPEGMGRPSKGNPKLESSLNQLLETHRREGLAEVQAFAETHMMVLDDDRVQVVIVTTQEEAISGLKEAVEALGGEYQGHYEGLLQALVPMGALESLAQRPDVRVIREPRRPIPLGPAMAGTVDTEGLGPSNASAWHSAGHTGSGVRVAVIDGGFTNYTSLLGTDLPGSVTTYDWTSSGMGGSSHGTACAEIVYDMAYGATMDLHKVSSDVDLGNAVTQAIADGVDIISMSLGWTLDGPGDGTGNLANIVNNARSNGIFYAAAAGNEALVSWSGPFNNDGSGFHLWASGQNINYFGPGTGSAYVIPAGYPIVCGLHWDDWTAVDQDYDMELYRWDTSSGWVFVTGSYNWQNGGAGQTPEEFIGIYAPYAAAYGVMVTRWSATRNVCLSLDCPKMTHLDEWVPGRSLSFPADSPDAITVGAVDVSSPYPLESYSSQGPTFGSGGTCSGGSTKPDIAAYANVSTVSYGAGAFNGTSAATPHVAGASALVKGAYPSYSVSQLQSYLENNAIDLGTSGKDNLYGSGRLYLGDPPSIGPIVYDSHLIDDDNSGESSGNDDGIVNCGETIELYVDLYNQGSDTATGVNATISTTDSYVTFLYNTSSSYPNIPGGGTGTNSDDFDFAVDPSTPDGHVIHFDLDITASNGGPWTDSFDVTVVCDVCNDPHEPNDTWGQATPIAYGDTLTDPDICPAGDVDYYAFTGNAGDTVVADIDAWAIGSYLDSYLYLYDTDGVTELTHNDDYDGLDSHIEYTLPVGGTYYLMVREYNHPNEGGPDYFYTISLALAPPPEVPDIEISPTSFEETVPEGEMVTKTLTISNTGTSDLDFSIQERDRGFQPALIATGPFADVEPLVPPEYQEAANTEGLDLPPAPVGITLAAGNVIRSWTSGLAAAWGIAYTYSDTVWVGEGWGSTDRIYEYLPDGTPTGRSYLYSWTPTYGPADSAFNWNTGMVWTVDVGGDDCLHEMDPSTGYTGNTICGPWTISQRGAAYDPTTDTWYVGGWNEGVIYHINSSGTLLDSAYVALSISGLAYNPDTQHLFAQVNGGANDVYVLDASVPGVYPQTGQFYIGTLASGAGLEIGCDGSLWAVDQSNEMVIQAESDETTSVCTQDVSWLHEDPISGTVSAGGSLPVDVIFDATGLALGDYTADLVIYSNDPDESPVTVAVVMHVVPGGKNYLPIILKNYP